MSNGEFTYQELDDSLFEHIRRQVVLAGNYPDLTLFQPTTPTNITAFNAALDAIKTLGTPVINTVGVGTFIDKGEAKLNTIYIHRLSTNKGSVSIQDVYPIRTDGLTTPPTPSTTYALVETSGYTQNISYEIRFNCADQRVANVISDIILLALGMGINYFSIYDLDTGNITPNKEMLVSYKGSTDINEYALKEYVYRYDILNCWVVTGSAYPNGIQRILSPTVVPITQIIRDITTNN